MPHQQAARISDFTAFMSLGALIEFSHTATLFMNPTVKQTARLCCSLWSWSRELR